MTCFPSPHQKTSDLSSYVPLELHYKSFFIRDISERDISCDLKWFEIYGKNFTSTSEFEDVINVHMSKNKIKLKTLTIKRSNPIISEMDQQGDKISNI